MGYMKQVENPQAHCADQLIGLTGILQGKEIKEGKDTMEICKKSSENDRLEVNENIKQFGINHLFMTNYKLKSTCSEFRSTVTWNFQAII